MAILTKKDILQIPICELIECKALYYEAIKVNEYYKNVDMFLNSEYNQKLGGNNE
jgi:hypothetical protein